MRSDLWRKQFGKHGYNLLSHVTLLEILDWYPFFSLFFKFFKGHMSFLWGHWYPVLDFWWRLPWVSKPGWTHLHAFLPVRYSSNSPLVQHLPTSWQLACQPSHFDPHWILFSQKTWFSTPTCQYFVAFQPCSLNQSVWVSWTKDKHFRHST